MMFFAKTNPEDFSVIKNGVDASIEIIRHDATGFYNIIKMLALVNKLKKQQHLTMEATGIPVAYNKKVDHWFANQSTIPLIETCKQLMVSDDVVYKLETGTSKKYSGTYVPELLYDQFMQWLDPAYAIKV